MFFLLAIAAIAVIISFSQGPGIGNPDRIHATKSSQQRSLGISSHECEVFGEHLAHRLGLISLDGFDHIGSIPCEEEK